MVISRSLEVPVHRRDNAGRCNGRWPARPFALGGGSSDNALVLGPRVFPEVVDRRGRK
jgi:hypothetical protein